MTEEIKEILDKLEKVANRETASRNALMEMKDTDYRDLLDCITNLQQENEKLLKKSYKDDVIITKAIEEYTKTYRTIYYTMKYYRDSKQIEKCDILYNDCIKKLDELDVLNILNGENND